MAKNIENLEIPKPKITCSVGPPCNYVRLTDWGCNFNDTCIYQRPLKIQLLNYDPYTIIKSVPFEKI